MYPSVLRASHINRGHVCAGLLVRLVQGVTERLLVFLDGPISTESNVHRWPSPLRQVLSLACERKPHDLGVAVRAAEDAAHE